LRSALRCVGLAKCGTAFIKVAHLMTTQVVDELAVHHAFLLELHFGGFGHQRDMTVAEHVVLSGLGLSYRLLSRESLE